MKLAILILALSTALPISGAAWAQSGVTATAKAGEIPLRITARGEVEADQAVLMVGVSQGGVDRESTVKQLHDEEQTVIAALGKIGIPVERVSISAPKVEETDHTVTPQNRFGLREATAYEVAKPIEEVMAEEQAASSAAGEAAYAAASAAQEAANPTRKPRGKPKVVKSWAASSTVTVTIENLELLPEAMRLAGVSSYGDKPVRFVFKDDAAAHRKAIERALANARLEAESFAAAMNYRVVRISAVSNTEPPISITDGLRAIGRFGGRGKELGMLAIRFSTVNVDYLIAPK